MRRLALALAVAALPNITPAEPARPTGAVRTGDARIEILGQPVRVGETIHLPEGFIRVEEEGTEDRNVGSFSVVPAATLGATALALAASPPVARDERAGAPAPTAAPPAACREQRNAYLRELWRMSGIEVENPDALLEGLEGGDQGARLGFYWFAFQTDPFRPLAWSSALRSQADALARCVREHGPLAGR